MTQRTTSRHRSRNTGLGWLTQKKVTYRRDVGAERKQMRAQHLEDLRYEKERKRLEKEIEGHDKVIEKVEAKIDKAKDRERAGAISESRFEQMKAHMEKEIGRQEELKRAAKQRISNPRHRNSAAVAPQSSTEFTLGYNLGQRDRDTASLRKTLPELRATFQANFAAALEPNFEWFEEGYASGYSGAMGAAVPTHENPDLYDKIQDHLRDGGAVAVRTSMRHTNYLPKHAKMFRRPTKDSERGVYVQRGKHWDYVFPEYVHFGRFKTNPESGSDESSVEYEQARKIAELFHGRPVKEEIVIDELIRQHDWYWRIGPLVSLEVKTLTGLKREIPFSMTEAGLVHLFCSPDGRQFYLRGGDQELNLDAIKMGEGTDWYRDHIIIGDATYITYQDKKKFHRFKLTDYFHKLGEVTKKRPQLLYDAFAKKMQIVGGQYRVETDDLVDSMSPGIVN